MVSTIMLTESLWADPAPSGDYGLVLGNAEQQLDVAWRNLSGVYEESRKPEALAARAPLPERITNAEIMFLLNSYTEASLLLSDLLEDTKRADPASLPKVLYYLGESNYQIKNYNQAKKYFAELIELKEQRYAVDALKRLIQIGDSLGELGYVDRYANLLTEMTGQTIPLEVAYAYAKSLIRQNQPKKVISILSPMDLTSLDGVKADYFLAVAYVMDNQFDAAISHFREVAKRAGEWQTKPQMTAQEKQDLSEIVDLCHLAVGRIYYEIGDFTNAIDSYQNISHRSKQFVQMLYDITWSYVRQAQQSGITEAEKEANYRRALSMLELLLGAEDNTVLAAEARLLEGNLLLRLSENLLAREKFETITARYGKIIENINAITKGYSTPQEYFKKVLETRQKGALGWENIMPEEVSIWAGEEKNVTIAMDTLHEVDRSRQWIDEGLQLMDTMLEAMETNNRLQFLPQLADLQKQQAQMKATFINLSEQVASLQRSIVYAQVTSDTKSELAKAQEERRKLEEAYKRIPQDANEYQHRKDLITESVDKTEKAAFKLGAEVASLVQQLDAMEKWFNSNYEQLQLTEAEIQEVKDRIFSERKVIQELDGLQKALNAKLSKERAVIKFLNEEEQRDQLVRSRYLAAVNHESELLKKANEELIAGKNTQDTLKNIEQRLSAFDPSSKEWQAAYSRLVRMVAQSKERLSQRGDDLQQLAKEIAAERQWVNPKGQPVEALADWQKIYIAQLDHIVSLMNSLEKTGQAQADDHKLLTEFVERLGKKPLTDQQLQRALKQPPANSAIINEFAAELLSDRILVARNRIELALSRLDVYNSRVRILVDRQTREIRNEILAQKQVFMGYKENLANLENGGTEVLSEVSSSAFEEVEKRFNSIILRADVGILDLVWNEKEAGTKKITTKVEERNTKLEILRQEFGDISEEEE